MGWWTRAHQLETVPRAGLRHLGGSPALRPGPSPALGSPARGTVSSWGGPELGRTWLTSSRQCLELGFAQVPNKLEATSSWGAAVPRAAASPRSPTDPSWGAPARGIVGRTWAAHQCLELGFARPGRAPEKLAWTEEQAAISSSIVYLVDYSCYRAPDSLKAPRCELMEHSRVTGNLDESSLEFQRKFLERSGLGEETYFPEAMHSVPSRNGPWEDCIDGYPVRVIALSY
ncbi:3-ketoacyl-CoA synthase 4 [Sesamum alatum]|uniref:3-ketoacyl-CoA synthase 4 n=1 Tax=Sesamum alatum TaxID=300844 RepID=A0AAE1YQ35_9LAMI|nr:3-ketoacyl-CoA synthase 4 [Sesamum alatum]